MLGWSTRCSHCRAVVDVDIASASRSISISREMRDVDLNSKLNPSLVRCTATARMARGIRESCRWKQSPCPHFLHEFALHVSKPGGIQTEQCSCWYVTKPGEAEHGAD